ncbi:MAG: helix-turn-helix transcriptional regulator, partial [Patescibacteria group bacterium]
GWKDTSRLSKIEQGRVGKPTRETIEKIIKALELNEQERGQLLYAGGYLPTDKEIEDIIKKVKTKIDNWRYPAYILDFSWRMLYTNDTTAHVFILPTNWKTIVSKSKPNILEAPFLKDILKSTIQKGDDESRLKPFAVAHIATFKAINHRFQNEAWYKKLIQSLMKHQEFRKLWPTIEPSAYDKFLRYEYKKITGIYDGKTRTLRFHMFVVNIISDPRFDLIFYTPADRKTDKYCLELKFPDLIAW